MMKRWLVVVRKVRNEAVEVDAEDYSHALDVAADLFREDGWRVDVDVVRQLGDPWVYTCGWCDLQGPSTLIIFDRATGNTFTEAEVVLLRRRVEDDLGLVVADMWNGPGCRSLSIRCVSRPSEDDMTDEDIAALCAPRPAAMQDLHDHND